MFTGRLFLKRVWCNKVVIKWGININEPLIMMTSSNGNIFRYWPFVRGIHRSPMNSPHKGQWRGALVFSLICAWINGWVSNGEAGDLRRHRAHYDVTVMCWNISDRTVCQTFHRIDVRRQMSLMVHKRCAREDECNEEHVGCFQTENPAIQVRMGFDLSVIVPMMVSLLTYICVTRSQWVNSIGNSSKSTFFYMYFSSIYNWYENSASEAEIKWFFLSINQNLLMVFRWYLTIDCDEGCR